MQSIAQRSPSSRFIPINPWMLSFGEGLSVDVFLKVDAHTTPKLYCSRRLAVKPQQLQRLVDSGISKLYVESESYRSYLSDLRHNWRGILDGVCPDNGCKMSLLCEIVRAVLGEQFSNNDTSAIVHACYQLSESIVSVLQEQSVGVGKLHEMMHHDHSLSTHSANVAMYITILARELGFSGIRLQQLVVGALLHDIGTLEISSRILDKPERLSEFEFREVRKHPTHGLRRLVDAQEQLSYDQLMMVYQHHEKANGSGYPVGLIDDEIHFWAKVCAVVNAFEGLTSHRPYRKQVTLDTAMAVLENGAGKELDNECVKCWRSLVLSS